MVLRKSKILYVVRITHVPPSHLKITLMPLFLVLALYCLPDQPFDILRRCALDTSQQVIGWTVADTLMCTTRATTSCEHERWGLIMSRILPAILNRCGCETLLSQIIIIYAA